MNNINWDQYEPVEEVPFSNEAIPSKEPIPLEKDQGIDWESFEPVDEKKAKKEPKALSWIERNFTSEGQEQQAAENRNLFKGVVSGLSAGYSELIPGLEVEKDVEKGFEGKLAGSLAPLGLATKLIGIPLQAAAALSPKFVKPLTALGNLLGISLVGGTYNALEESAEKSLEKGEFVPPSPETIAEQGAKWAALDIALNSLGLTARFAKGLFDKSAELGKPVIDVLDNILKEAFQKFKGGDKVAEKALSILENQPLENIEKEIALSKKAQQQTKASELAAEKITPEQRSADLKEKKLSPTEMDKLGQSMSINVQPYLPAEFEAEKIAEEAIDESLNSRVESIAQRAPNERELGQNIQKDLETQIEASQKETDALYDIAKEVENTAKPNLQKTATAIVNEIKKLQKGNLKLSPEGFKKAEEDLFKTLEDLGYHPVLDEAGNLSSAVREKQIPLSQSIEVKKRLNKIINYDLLDSSAQDVLKNPTAALREDIRKGYGKNTRQREAFEEAERKYGENAEKKGKKSITKIRLSETPETTAKIIKTPSGLADVKDVVSKEQFAQIERELLEHLRGLSEERANAFYREVRPSLSSDTRSLAEEIIQSKAPKSSPTRKQAQKNKIEETIYEDISKASLTGERPDKVLNLWKTKEGQQLIKNALKDNPNKEQIIKYLSDQSFNDFAASVVTPEGKVNFKKLNEFLKDPATADNIRLVAGEDGYNFLKNLQTISERVAKNSSILERTIAKSTAPEREKILKEIDKLGQKRIAKQKSKNLEPSKVEKIGQNKWNKETIKDRKETAEILSEKGKERFKKAKEKRENLSKQEKEAADAAEKRTLMYKLDDFVKSYGIKGKGLLTALGLWQIGPIETVSGIAAYEAFIFLSKNPKARQALKKAAAGWQSSIYFLQSLDSFEEAL